MKILRILEDNINDRFIDAAVDALKSGDLIVYPTDTLYALGCDALNNNAINKICRIKGINPDKQNLSVVCDSISMAAEYARFDNRMFKMMKANLPGPFTFIFPSSSTLPKVFKGRKTVGIRIPGNKIALEIARRLGNPIMTTTIKYDDDDYAVSPDLIADAYDDVAKYVIDGGEGGLIPSTVVDCTGDEPVVVRDGKGELVI